MTTTVPTDFRELTPSEFSALSQEQKDAYRPICAAYREQRKAEQAAAKKAAAKAKRDRLKDPEVIARNADMSRKAQESIARLDADPEVQAYRAAVAADEAEAMRRIAALPTEHTRIRARLAHFSH